MTNKELSYEEIVKELNETVENLENPDIPLEESIEKFKKGMELANEAQKKLEKFQETISILTDKNGVASTKEVDESELRY